ncbi:uncharacterized protein ASPGLDRAFT_48480 [Aspergillus glaucus CBS 516.65]|uniref:Uncharacterized protein n=1 Tax=Aspergillus glaucus CBS 516.65 TaxID=1160497 RepID=A0A1L9VGS6_ASPGL|nr:hypothetical protein ASPGLDRAFT_48480 [Aspergillus glaucus CBS 516.65]OJJ83114.1 hypothetical protein ASPGLDRAFT_48480 [Aspergillus glaucus CBS 516.65]
MLCIPGEWQCGHAFLLDEQKVLHLAVQIRNKEMVCILVKKFGADPLIKDQSGKTAVD